MLVDPEYLRQHYASLSDEALLAINRGDLVETAQKCYDDEVRQRQVQSRQHLRSEDEEDVFERVRHPEHAESEAYGPSSGEDQPEWLDEASEVYSRSDWTGTVPAADVLNAREALEAAGIPCYLDLSKMSEETNVSPPPTHLWRIMVPGNLNQWATSILDRDMFNADFEAQWRTHLEMLSDEELRAMSPRVSFCGLFDRVERVTKAYDEEIASRRLR